jgi:hypothetical protein
MKFLKLAITIPMLYSLTTLAVDLAPLYKQHRFQLSFEKGLQLSIPETIFNINNSKKTAIMKPGFQGKSLTFVESGRIIYTLPIGKQDSDWTFWFWFKAEYFPVNIPFLRIVNQDSTFKLNFSSRHKPKLSLSDKESTIGIIQANQSLKAKNWYMFAIRKKTLDNKTTFTLLINGIPQGEFKSEKELFKTESSVLVIGSRQKSFVKLKTQYDNFELYTVALSDGVLKAQYEDDRRTAKDLLLIQQEKDIQKYEYIYQFPELPGKNILKNSSFEHNILKGWWISPRAERQPVVVNDTHAVHGNKSIKFSQKANHLQTHLIAAKCTDTPLVLSFYAKADKPKSNALISITTLDNRVIARKRFMLTNGYTRYSFSAKLPEVVYGLRLSMKFTLPDNGSAWLDAVQLESGKLSDYKLAETEMFTTTGRPFNTFIDAEPVMLTIALGEKTILTQDQPATLSIYDIRGHELLSYDLKQILKEKRNHTINVIPIPRYGAFRAVTRLGQRVVDEQNFARIPSPRIKGIDHKSQYGGHYPSYSENLALAELIGSHWNRNHDAAPYAARWKSKNHPSDNNFQFRNDILDLNRKYGQEMVATMVCPRKDQTKFGNDIYALVKGYKGNLKFMEIYNEPTSVIPPKEYAELLKLAYTNAKKADPNITILGMSTWDVVHRFTRTVIAEGGAKYMDVFSAHFYNYGKAAWPIPDGNWGQGMRDRRLRKFLNENGASKLPIWNTESGIYIDSFYKHYPWRKVKNRYASATWCRHHSARWGAIWMVQNFPVNFGSGAEKFLYYFSPLAASPIRMGGHELAEFDRSLKPAAVAYAVSAHMLDHSEPVASINGGIWGFRAYEFKRDGKSLVVAWNQSKSPVYLDIDKIDYVDMLGTPVTHNANVILKQRPALLLFKGTMELPKAEKRLFLDIEPKYFPNMTLKKLKTLLPKTLQNIPIRLYNTMSPSK